MTKLEKSQRGFCSLATYLSLSYLLFDYLVIIRPHFETLDAFP